MESSKLVALLKKAQGDLTQNEFSKRCGISSSNLTRIYRNKQKPSPELLKKISDYTKDNPSYEDLMVAAEYWKKESDSLFTPVKGLFNYRCRKLREENGYSISELSKITGIDENTLKNYEIDLLPTRPLEITALASAYQVRSNYVTGESPYRTYDEEINSYGKAEVLAERINTLNPDDAKEFLLVANRVVGLIRMTESKKYPKFPFVDTFLRTIIGMSELLLEMSQFQNLLDSNDRTQINNADDEERIKIYTNAIKKSNELYASIRAFFDGAKEFWIDTGDKFTIENYKELVKYFSLDKEDKSSDWRYYSIEDQSF